MAVQDPDVCFAGSAPLVLSEGSRRTGPLCSARKELRGGPQSGAEEPCQSPLLPARSLLAWLVHGGLAPQWQSAKPARTWLRACTAEGLPSPGQRDSFRLVSWQLVETVLIHLPPLPEGMPTGGT